MCCVSGLSEGVVFDSVDGVSHSVPVFDGHYLPHAVQRFPLAGVDVTLHLIKVSTFIQPPDFISNLCFNGRRFFFFRRSLSLTSGQ